MKDRQKERKNVQLMKRVNELRTAHIMQEITAHNIFSINLFEILDSMNQGARHPADLAL